MTYEELCRKRSELYRECEENSRQLDIKYAQEHNPVKIGDIVTDHFHTIKVESMSVCTVPIPYMKYIGPTVKSNGIPWKRQPQTPDPVFQINIKTINGIIYQFKRE